MTNQIHLGDCLSILPTLPEKSVRLAYIDPPFGLGHRQERTRIRAREAQDGVGDRAGFGDKRYTVETIEDTPSYDDTFEDYEGFLIPRILACLDALTDDATLMVHLNPVNAPYIRVALDSILGRDRFLNEIVWAYDFGGRSKKRWPAKHDTILVYVRDPDHYTFNYEEIDRIPYLAPSLVGADKAERGKTITDVHWHTIVPTNGAEKTGYPTQKPLGLLKRFVRVHSNPGDTVLDFFAGSGSLGAAAVETGRHFILIDKNPEAIEVMRRRFSNTETTFENEAKS